MTRFQFKCSRALTTRLITRYVVNPQAKREADQNPCKEVDDLHIIIYRFAALLHGFGFCSVTPTE